MALFTCAKDSFRPADKVIPAMSEPASLLLREFLTWIASRPRSYAEAMEAWRSTCPRHTVWEDALGDGLIQVESAGARNGSQVTLTPRGRALLDECRPISSVQ
jgi:hypothetical protein